MSLATWGDLMTLHCTLKWYKAGNKIHLNPYYEDMACRRYNYAPSKDITACRLVFLNDVLLDSRNKTLVRDGRFIWCRNLEYEGLNAQGLRHISFTIDKGQKRFIVAENNLLAVPARTFVNNKSFFRRKEATFRCFASVFGYKNTMNMMCKRQTLEREEFYRKVREDNPHKPGTLVAPRLGYFYPTGQSPPAALPGDLSKDYPYGIILGASADNNHDHSGREFYRVKFGETTYERVHPVQMEIINEV